MSYRDTIRFSEPEISYAVTSSKNGVERAEYSRLGHLSHRIVTE
jgi:hypothetical protein